MNAGVVKTRYKKSELDKAIKDYKDSALPASVSADVAAAGDGACPASMRSTTVLGIAKLFSPWSYSIMSPASRTWSAGIVRPFFR